MRANVGVGAQPFHHRVARLAAPFIATAPVARAALSDPTLRGPTEKRSYRQNRQHRHQSPDHCDLISRAHAWRGASRHLADVWWLERRGGGRPARWQRRSAQLRPREGRSRRSSSTSRSPHVRESALRKKSNPVLSPRRGCQRSLPTVKGARRWILNPREGRMAARLTCEACACVRAAGQRGSKKLRVCTTATRLEDSSAESVLVARRWSAMRLSECIAPRTVACARLRGAAGRRKARERAFSMVCTALILLVVCCAVC